MTCQETAPLIDALADGSLDAADVARVEAHLAGCAACRDDLEGLRRVMQASTALPRTVEPGRDLWTGIATRLDQPQAPQRVPAAIEAPLAWWQRPASLLAAAMVLVALSSSVTALLVAPGTRGISSVTGSNLSQTLPASLARVERDYLRAAADLQEALDRLPLDPVTRNGLARLLTVVDDAIGESRAALASAPDHAGLRDLLWTAHRRKLDLLEQATRLPARS